MMMTKTEWYAQKDLMYSLAFNPCLSIVGLRWNGAFKGMGPGISLIETNEYVNGIAKVTTCW